MLKVLKLKIRLKLKNNEPIKILFLEGISNPITLKKLIKTEKAKYFINVRQSSYHLHEKNFIIEYVTSFGEYDCEKRFISYNNKFKTCNYIINDFEEVLNIKQIYKKLQKRMVFRMK